MAEWILTVGEVNEYVRKRLAGDPMLRGVKVRGEISGWKNHYSGHKYFTLKDDSARIASVMFRQSAMGLDFVPQDGMKVVCTGSVSLFVRDGAYQMYVESMEKQGVGDLYAQFERLKKALADEGLFDPSLKKTLPVHPKVIGLVTSATGAAVRDMIRVAKKRNPNVGILLRPAQVQGEGAAQDIAQAIDDMNAHGGVDVLLVGRGGGSIEDLWAFNEEIVARAIFRSEIPVISCVGHEIDFTIADFVADERAATPSQAAEIAVPVLADEQAALRDMAARMNYAMQMGQRLRKARLQAAGAGIAHKRDALTAPFRESLERMRNDMTRAAEKVVQDRQNRLQGAQRTLLAMNPENVLKRGYAIVRKGDAVVSGAQEIRPGDTVNMQFDTGRVYANVTETEIRQHE